MFEYIEIYKNSLYEDKEIENIERLEKYFRSNKHGLLPYQKQEIDLSEQPEGLEYRNYGKPCMERDCKKNETQSHMLE